MHHSRRELERPELSQSATVPAHSAEVPAWRLSFLYAALFFELGINLPFFPVWLRSHALSDAAIGIIVAAPFYLRLVANPLVAALADRRGRLGEAVAVCAVVVALASTLLPVADGFTSILLVVVAIAFAQGPLIALTDALTLANLASVSGRLHRYGGIRLWGSIAFALANIGAGVLLVWLPDSAIALFLIGAAVVVAAAAIAVAHVSRQAAPTVRATAPAPIERAALVRILMVVAGAALIQASHGLVYTFSTLHWQEKGLSSAAIGTLWALGVVAEVGFFALLHRLLSAGIGAGTLLAVGGAAAALRWLGMAADPANVVLVPLQALHALSFGATHAGSVLLLAQLAPSDKRAQVQGWLAAAWAGLMAAFISLSGTVMPLWGQGTYLVMAAAAGVGLALVIAVLAATPRRR